MGRPESCGSAGSASSAGRPSVTERRSGMPPVVRSVFAAVGLGFYWQVFRSRNIDALFPSGTDSFTAYLLAAALCFVVPVVVPRLVERAVSRRVPVLLSSVAATLLLCLQACAASFGWWPTGSAVSTCIAVLAGAQAAYLTVAWYTGLSSGPNKSDRSLIGVLFASSILSFVIAIGLFSLSPVPELLPVLVPVCSGVCFVGAGFGGRLGRGGAEADDAVRDPAVVVVPRNVVTRLANIGAPPSGFLLALLAVSVFFGGVALNMLDRSQQPVYTLWLKYAITLALVAVVFVAFYRAGAREGKVAFCVWLLLSLAIVGGFALVGLSPNGNSGVVTSVLTACITCSQLLVFFLLVRDSFECTLAYRNLTLLYAGPATVYVAVGNLLAPHVSASALSSVAGVWTVDVPTVMTVMSVALALVTIAALGLIGAKSFDLEVAPDWDPASPASPAEADARAVATTGGAGGSGGAGGAGGAGGIGATELAGGASPAGGLGTSGNAGRSTTHDAPGERRADGALNGSGITPEALALIATRYGLTARETQVMVYAFKGYSLQRVSELDTVSMNTVKSHWKNVYRKLGVHTRQELIDLVERDSAEGRPARG